MAAGVRDLPGVRPGARVHMFLEGDEEGIASHVEDFDADWIAVVAPDTRELISPLRVGNAMELELPQAGGSLFLVGRLIGRRTDDVPLLLVRVDQVAADPGLGQARDARTHFRQSLWLPARAFAYRLAGDVWHEASGIVRDVSAGGVSILTDADIPAGSSIHVDCPVPLEPHGLAVAGTVVSCRATGTERRRRWIVNVRFDGMDRRERSRLVGQLHRYQWLLRRRQR
jgi:hypothetical protein